MGLATFRAGARIKIDGVTFDITGRPAPNRWQLVEVDTGLRDEQSDEALWKAFLTNHLRFVLKEPTVSAAQQRMLSSLSEAAETTPPSCSEDAAKLALNRWKFTRQFTELKGVLPVAVALEETWSALKWPEMKPGLRTVQYWCTKVHFASDPVAALVDKTTRKGNRSPRYPEAVIDIADRVIQEKYLRRNPRLTTAKASQECAKEVRKENQRRLPSDQLPVPGQRMFKSRVKLIPEREIITRRYGADAALAKFRTSLGGIETTRVLERGEIDHTPLSIVLLDEDFMPWGRASASICVDAHIPVPTGVYFGAECPSIVSVSHCMASSVLPKTELLKRYPDVKGRWDCYGVHETYVIDNGLEEHASALRHATSELGASTVEFGARKAPWFKPHVERQFRTLDLDLLQTLPGCTGENFSVRPAFDPKKDMLLRRSTFEKIFMIWLVDIRLRERQPSLGDISLAEAWKRSITLDEQLVPTRRILLERLFLRRECGRSLDHEGIQYDCIIYNSTDMGALRAELGASLKVDIWVSDEDLGYIYVQVPNKDVSIRVPCLDQRYASGLTRWQHEKCKAMQRVSKDEGLQLTLDEARDRISELIEKDVKEHRHAQRKARSRATERPQRDPTSTPHPSATDEPSDPVSKTPSAADEALMRRDDAPHSTFMHTSMYGE
jgi:putative transposase